MNCMNSKNRERSGGNCRKSGAFRLRALFAVLVLTLLLSGCGKRMEQIRKDRDAGIEAMAAQDWETAVQSFRHAMSYYGTSRPDGIQLDILRYLGEAQMRSGKYGDALATYETLMDADGREPEYLNLACVCKVLSGGDLPEALALYQEAGEKQKTSGGHREALYTLGEAMTASGDPELREQAFQMYREAAENEGVTAGLCARIGRLYFEAGDTAQARVCFEEGMAMTDQVFADPEAGEAAVAAAEKEQKELRYNIAVCQEYDGKYAEALKAFREIQSEYDPEKTDEALQHEILFLEGLAVEAAR